MKGAIFAAKDFVKSERAENCPRRMWRIQLEGLDLTQKAISRMEAGKRLMTDYELKYLADALGVSIPELFENEPEMNSKK